MEHFRIVLLIAALSESIALRVVLGEVLSELRKIKGGNIYRRYETITMVLEWNIPPIEIILLLDQFWPRNTMYCALAGFDFPWQMFALIYN